MEALEEVLSCPVCLELFTPPVLVLVCAHNFCKQCLEKILTIQNCTHVNGHFCCPICRKVIYLRGRGIPGLQRNILVEGILEKFKDVLENIRAQEQKQLSQTCVTDDEPIGAICKLFGTQEHRSVAQVLQKSEDRPQTRKEAEKLINGLTSSTIDIQVMIDTVGTSLLNGISCRIAALKAKLQEDYYTKLEKLQPASSGTEPPMQLYQQMKAFLEQHSNSVQFLQEDKKFKKKTEQIIEGSSFCQVPTKYKISMKQYFEELIRGINIKDYLSPTANKAFPSTSDLQEACMPLGPAFDFSGESPDQTFCRRVLGIFEKTNDMEQDCSEKHPTMPATTHQTVTNPLESYHKCLESRARIAIYGTEQNPIGGTGGLDSIRVLGAALGHPAAGYTASDQFLPMSQEGSYLVQHDINLHLYSCEDY
ncbi:hypothetical protein Y1Q_0023183 [Alligator mississippiensis]|uniref:RING-type domain-containing protein n=1 Tax=Alligator mississippiensis TaxID=8496 RepID=A0A151MZ50_ALLMI|nr:hypothetical protein Y1Q_0023183 [Alligator mississippiensis]